MPRLKDCSRYIITVLIALLIAFSVASALTYKEPIQNATISDLEEINGIGEVLACEIYDYVKCNPSCEVGDLIVIDGIGQVRLEEIERTFR